MTETTDPKPNDLLAPELAVGLFATPVVAFQLPNVEQLNADLAARLLAEEKAQPSWQRANVGGWHSTPDLARRDDPALRRLFQNIVEIAAHNTSILAGEIGLEMPQYRYGVAAWATILRDGHYMAPHEHGDVHWSAAYYVDAGDEGPAPSGQLAFMDPRRSGRPIPNLDLFPSSFGVKPRTGMLVIFPGWLQHYVHAYRGAKPRICISCNITLEPPTP